MILLDIPDAIDKLRRSVLTRVIEVKATSAVNGFWLTSTWRVKIRTSESVGIASVSWPKET